MKVIKMSKLRPGKKFEWIGNTTQEHNGREISVEIFQRGERRFEVRREEIDTIVELTTNPKKWLNKKVVVPTDYRDEDGYPIYQVLELNSDIKELPKPRPLTL
ncbi:hypothetical protein JXL21_02495 [Candidatus Bathyarchaeota archaeon]|nr:hypothetical protein [Candidatus Bathyarchaeota archaeon]